MPGPPVPSSLSRRRCGGPGRAHGLSRRPYQLTRVGEAIAPLMTATASKVTFPINASSAVKVYVGSAKQRTSASAQPLPAKLGWKILRNQFVIEGPQLLDIRALEALGIKVVRIESSNPLEHFLVPTVHEVLIFPFAVRRIEGVIADHVKGLRRQGTFDDVVQLFVMAPREVNVFQAAAFRVDAGSSLVFRLAAAWIVGEELMKDDLVRIGAAYRKRIAHHGPLWLSVKT